MNKKFQKSLALFLLFAIFSVFSCKKEKTEEERFAELKSGFKYKMYNKASKLTIPPIVKLYNAKRDQFKISPPPPEIEESIVRLLLAYSWAVTRKAPFAIAEGYLAEEAAQEDELKFLSHSVIAIALYEEGLKNIGHEESLKANTLLEKNYGKEKALEAAIAFHLIMGSLCVYSNKLDAARFHFAGFSNLTGIHWPYQIFDALLDIKNKDIQKGLTKLKKTSQDETVPPEVRKVIADGIAKIEEKAGPVDSRLFWPRAVSTILFSELKKVGSSGIGKLTELIDKAKRKLE